jgi:hypothetical protein
MSKSSSVVPSTDGANTSFLRKALYQTRVTDVNGIRKLAKFYSISLAVRCSTITHCSTIICKVLSKLAKFYSISLAVCCSTISHCSTIICKVLFIE